MNLCDSKGHGEAGKLMHLSHVKEGVGSKLGAAHFDW